MTRKLRVGDVPDLLWRPTGVTILPSFMFDVCFDLRANLVQLCLMQLLACMLRYVDSRMVLLPSQYIFHPTFEVLLDQDFYDQPFVLQEEPDQEFWGFQVEFDPFGIFSPVHLEPFSPTRFDERIYLTLSYHHQQIRSICIGPSKIGRLRPVVHQSRIQRCSSLFGQLLGPTFVAQFQLIFTF